MEMKIYANSLLRYVFYLQKICLNDKNFPSIDNFDDLK